MAISCRAAMRVLPFALILDQFDDSPYLALATIRCTLTSAVAAARPTPDVRTAAFSAFTVVVGSGFSAASGSGFPASGGSVNLPASAAFLAASSDAAAEAADAAVAAAAGAASAAAEAADAAAARSASAAAHSALAVADYAAAAAASASKAAYEATASEAAHSLTYDDTNLELDRLALVAIPVPDLIQALHAKVGEGGQSALAVGGPWTFWAKWYGRAMAGNPLPWDLQEQIALIPDEIWDAGPEAVGEEIARIEAEFELRARIAELEAAQLVSGDARFGIGGNAPPEEIEDPQVAEQATIIWDAVAGLKEEVEAEEPDASRVASLIEKLGAALKAVMAWCGRKGDLVVDTTIKASIGYVIPAGATGYFILVPSKAEAVLKAAQAWLPFLAP